jgi:histidinol phosphatase-like enzyme
VRSISAATDIPPKTLKERKTIDFEDSIVVRSRMRDMKFAHETRGRVGIRSTETIAEFESPNQQVQLLVKVL